MDLPDAVTVVIAGPLLVTVADGGMGANDMIVALPFIRMDGRPSLGEAVDVFFQGLLVGVMNQPQPHLPTFAANRAHNRGSVIIVSAMTALFIGPWTGRVVRTAVIVTFFPPHSETSRQFQSGYRLRGFEVAGVGHWFASLGAPHARFVG